MSADDVHATVVVGYGGTILTKAITVRGGETDAVKVNRAMESLSRQVNAMVQAEQAARRPPQRDEADS